LRRGATNENPVAWTAKICDISGVLGSWSGERKRHVKKGEQDMDRRGGPREGQVNT